METFSELLALCVGNSPVTGEFPAQRPVTRSFDIFFDLPLNKRLSKHSWGWRFETPSRPLWRHVMIPSFTRQYGIATARQAANIMYAVHCAHYGCQLDGRRLLCQTPEQTMMFVLQSFDLYCSGKSKINEFFWNPLIIKSKTQCGFRA